ncbi:hypothetical protein B0H14DRAFT_2684357 [Mycena olivaceomarginata]|nr:hypothetical protein B0H14DRAFT_2684357 [Mycena olivaceomarginata]
MAPPAVPTDVPVDIVNCAENVFDLAYSNRGALAPVHSLNRKAGGRTQKWILTAYEGQTFSVKNSFANTFLSFTTAGTPVPSTYAQICGNPTIETKWKITASADGTGYNIMETGTNQALMSWPSMESNLMGACAPLTLHTFDPNEKQMIFKFKTLPTDVLVNIVNCAENVFDLANGNRGALAPVHSLNRKAREGGTQRWILTAYEGQTFSVKNSFANTFLSFTTAGTSVPSTYAQICGNPTIETKWKITASADGLGYNIFESVSNQALMSWPSMESNLMGACAPLTLHNFDPSERQMIFNFETVN